MNKEVYPIVAIIALFIVIMCQPVASADGSEGHIIEAWDELVGIPVDEIAIHVHIQDDEDEIFADEYRVYIYSEGGSELDYEPDTYWKNLDGQDHWFTVSSDLDPLWNIYDLGDRYCIVLMEQHNGVQDELWMDTPSPLKAIINIPLTGEVLQTITFDGSGSYAGGLTNYIAKYKWDFGDGSATHEIDTSSILHEVEDVYHTYWKEDDYVVTLTVWDTDGNSNSAKTPIRISNQYGSSGLDADEKTALRTLAMQYSPVLYVHPQADHNCPGPVSQILDNSELKQKSSELDPTIVDNPLVEDLMAFSGENYYLDEPGWASDPEVHTDLGDDKTSYVHFRKDNGLYFVQYYFFYYYNDGVNNHEADLEMIQLSFEKRDSSYFPLMATYSQHTDFSIADFNFGEKRCWSNIEKYIDGNGKLTNHPIVYVSSGTAIYSDANSHANYFYQGDSGFDIGFLGDWTDDSTMKIEFLTDDLVFLPNLENRLSDQDWTAFSWLQFAGNWGECGAEVNDAPPGPLFCSFENSDIGDDTTCLRWIDVYEFEEGRLYDGSHNEHPFDYPTLDVNDKSVKVGDAVVLEAYLMDESQNLLNGKRLSFYVDGEFQANGVTNDEGYTSITYQDTTVLGGHQIQVVFKGQNDGDPDYAWCDEKATLAISADDQTGEGASPFITSNLQIIQSSPYYVGNTLTAQFTIKNKGTASITFDVLTVGGRDSDGEVADFTFNYGVTLEPGESYSYEGDLTLTKTENYHFFCAYKTPDGTWNTAIPSEEGITNVFDVISLADIDDGSDISDEGEDGNDFLKDLFEPVEEIPGFELIIVICAVALILFWKRNWKKYD